MHYSAGRPAPSYPHHHMSHCSVEQFNQRERWDGVGQEGRTGEGTRYGGEGQRWVAYQVQETRWEWQIRSRKGAGSAKAADAKS